MDNERLIRDEEAIEDTEIIVIADRSGSMHSIVDDAVGGFNQFIADQKELPGNAFLTLAIFDDEYEVVCESTPIQEMKDITRETIKPRGNTALLDAIAKGVIDAIPRAGSSKTIVVIITDGGENASNVYDIEKIKKLIKDREKAGWKFMFLGANIDAFAVGNSMGVDSHSTMQYDANSRGITQAYVSISDTVSSFRTGGS
jgi:Mg-chelatase subunit ChlD